MEEKPIFSIKSVAFYFQKYISNLEIKNKIGN